MIVTSESIATGTPSTNFISYTNASASSDALTVPSDKSNSPVIGEAEASLAAPSAALIVIVDKSESTTPSSVIEELLPEGFEMYDKNKRKKVKRIVKLRAYKKLGEILNNDINNLNAQLKDIFRKSQGSDMTDISNLDLDNLDIETIDNQQTFKDHLKEIVFSDEQEDYIDQINVKIIDFGNCEFFDKKQQDEISIRNYRPPENIMNEFFNEKADIWSIGCIFFELFTGEYLFEIDSVDNDIEKDRRFLFEIFEIIGKIPRNKCLDCDYTDDLFDNKGRIKKHKNCEYTSLKEILIDGYDYSPDKSQIIHQFLMNFFDYNVQTRYSATEALNDRYLR